MKSPLISVVVPIYKVEAYLNQCVESILSQTYKNLEVILVDDGSPDNCPRMCDEWAEKDKRIKVLHKKNGGLSDARNAGMEVATGEYIAFLDSDDWLDSCYYELLITEMMSNGCDIISGGYSMTFSRESVQIKPTVNKVITMNSHEAMSNLIEDNLIKQVVWNKLYKRSLVSDVLFAVGKCHEDVFWSYQVIGKAQKIAVIDYDGLYYYQRPDSIMGEGFSVKRLDSAEAKSLRILYLKENFPDLTVKGIVDLYITCMYLGQQAVKSKGLKEKKEIIYILKKYLLQFPLTLNNIKSYKLSHKIWIVFSRKFFKFTCIIRNLLKIGV